VLEEEKVLGERVEGGRINLVGLPSIAGDWDDQEESALALASSSSLRDVILSPVAYLL
jgi:hypothetical protein